MEKIKIDIQNEIYSNGDFHIYAGWMGSESVSVKVDGFELADGEKTLVGIMGNYKGQKSFQCKYEEFDYNSKQAKSNLLCSIPGIKQKTAKRILDQVEDINIYKTDDYPKIKGIGAGTVLLIREGLQKLESMETFKELNMMLGDKISPTKIKSINELVENLEHGLDEFKLNPYKILIENADFGFKAADKIGLGVGVKVDNPIRLKYLVEYVVKYYTSMGNCYILKDDLLDKLSSLNIRNVDQFVEENERLEIDGEKVYTKDMFEAETRIPYHLRKIQEQKTDIKMLDKYDIDELIKDFEKINKMKFDKMQIEGIKNIVNNKVSILTGGAGCVDCDTEFFNGHKWKKISEYQKGEKVLQYNHFGNSNLVYPLEYHKYKSEYLWHFKTNRGLDQCLSDEHNVIYMTSKDNLYRKSFKDIRINHEATKGFRGKFLTTFNYSGTGLYFNEFEIRLQVAIKADGCLRNENTYHWEFNLKKQRKINRLRMLLNKCNITYTETKQKTEYTRFYFNYYTSKIFDSEWYLCNKEQFNYIFDEVTQWDARYKIRNDFSSTIKENADFIQFVGSSLGYRTNISILDRVGTKKNNNYEYKSIEYIVHFSKHTLISFTQERENHIKTKINKYKTKDNYKYCFTVPSNKLILRRNNKIFITGNSGKTTLLKCALFILKELNFRPFLTAPTGKASRRMEQATGSLATTIHRFLNVAEDSGTHRQSVMVVDEFSMVDTELFYDLLRTMEDSPIDFKKLILVGDPGQLPSVQPGNCLHDLIESKIISCVKLQKVFRQKGDSNIIDIATKINKNECFDLSIKKKDFYCKQVNDSTCKDSILYFFNYLLEKYEDIDRFYSEVQFIAPIKKGATGVNNINEMLKKQINPVKEKDKLSKWFPFDKGDKIMCIKNDRENEIMNGESGRISDEDKTTFSVYYKDLDRTVCYKKNSETVKNFQLAYCSTIHKLQGSEFRYIVIVMNQDSPFMDSRILYTGITRGKQTVIYLSNKQTTEKVVARNNREKRNTFLKERMISEFKEDF